MKKINVQTDKHDDMIDITHEVQQYVRETGIQNGTVMVYCPHTTAGITINENADPDVKRDMLRRLDEVFPWEHSKDRHMEGNTAAHMKASYMGASQHVLVHHGDLVLGTWQESIFVSLTDRDIVTFMYRCHLTSKGGEKMGEFTALLQIEHGIIQAPMAGGAVTPQLVAAVSQYGVSAA